MCRIVENMSKISARRLWTSIGAHYLQETFFKTTSKLQSLLQTAALLFSIPIYFKCKFLILAISFCKVSPVASVQGVTICCVTVTAIQVASRKFWHPSTRSLGQQFCKKWDSFCNRLRHYMQYYMQKHKTQKDKKLKDERTKFWQRPTLGLGAVSCTMSDWLPAKDQMQKDKKTKTPKNKTQKRQKDKIVMETHSGIRCCLS